MVLSGAEFTDRRLHTMKICIQSMPCDPSKGLITHSIYHLIVYMQGIAGRLSLKGMKHLRPLCTAVVPQ